MTARTEFAVAPHEHGVVSSWLRARSRYFLIAPTLVLLVGFLLIPYVNMLVMSFRNPSTRAIFAPGFTANNYLSALTDSFYLKVLWDTMVFGVFTTAVCLVIGFPVAYHLARTNSRFKGVLYACILSPLLVGVVVRTYGWIVLLANNGLINTGLRDLGLVETFIPLMYNNLGVGIGLVHVFLPFMVLPLLGAIQSIDPALEEASQSLGASRLRTMVRVVLPLSWPGIQAGTILVFVLTISSYVIPILLGSFRVLIMPLLVVQQLLDAMLWPFGAALAFILAVSSGAVIYVYLIITSSFMLEAKIARQGRRMTLTERLVLGIAAVWSMAGEAAKQAAASVERRKVIAQWRRVQDTAAWGIFLRYRRSVARWAYLAGIVLIYAFLLLPLIIVVLSSFNSGEVLKFPPEGFSLRWYVEFFDSVSFMNSLFFSLKIAVLCTVCSTILGTMTALYSVRFAGRWRELLRVLLMAPLLLPEILTAIALLFFYFNIGIGTTFVGLLIGHVLITLPFVFLGISASLHNFDISLEEAARSLGAGKFVTFMRITLPIIKPGIIAGAMLAFIISFDLFAISLLLKGVGVTTLPIQLFDYVRWDFDPTAAAVATVSIAITLSVVMLTEWLVGLRSLRF